MRRPQEGIDTFDDYSFDRLIAVGVGNIGQIWNPKGLAIDQNTNQIYVAQGFIECVSIFSESGDFIDVLVQEHWNPWGVAIHEDNLYVTDTLEHTVYHFTLAEDIRLVAKQGGRGSTRFKEPKQLAVSKNGDVFVPDYLNHRIQILDSSLQYKREFSYYLFKYPCDVKLTQDEVLVLSDSPPLCIHVFSQAGDKLRSLITCGRGMQVVTPQFFCIDPNGSFIISDKQAHQIKVFSNEGTLLHTLGKRGREPGMFICPNGIALTRSLKLITSSRNSKYGLQIYFCK